jgi:hypothetical protein
MATKRKTTSAKTTSAKTISAEITAGRDRQASSEQVQSTPTDAVSLLKADHRKVEQLFQKYEASNSDSEKQDLTRQICTELIVHTKLEEEIFYPACREKAVEHHALDEAQIEHDSAKILIGELMRQSSGGEFYDATVSVLSEYIKHHVGEEEKPSEGIFAKAKAAAVDMNALGQRLQARKQELLMKAGNQGFRPPQPRALGLSLFDAANLQEHQAMDRRFDRDRDEQGRFTSDDDDRDYQRSRYGSRSGGRDDDNRRGSRSDNRDRDEYGRFTSDDERGNYSRGRSSSSNDRDRDEYGRFTSDDDRGGYSSGRSSSSNDRDRDEYGRFASDDDRGGYARGRSSSLNDRDRDEYGRFTSDQRSWENRGNWRGSSRDYDDDGDDRSSRGSRSSGSGWYGDSEGHAEAARRGREERGDSRSSRNRSGDDDNDRRSSSRSSGSQGGWFGDSRGHAEAARRGWQNRN